MVEKAKKKLVLQTKKTNENFQSIKFSNEDEEEAQIQEKINSVKRESKSKTEKMLDKLSSTTSTAITSSLKLKEQGKKLNEMNEDMESMQMYMDYSERQLRGINSIFGATKNLFSSSKKYKDSKLWGFTHSSLKFPKHKKKTKATVQVDEIKTKATGDKHLKDIQERVRHKDLKEKADFRNNEFDQQASETGKGSNPFDNEEDFGFSSTNRSEATSFVKQNTYVIRDEVDEDLDRIAKAVRNLKGIAIEMNQDISSQTETVDRLGTNTSKVYQDMHRHKNKAYINT